jgi:beta-phosphoglucomutase-like phosphatase (HAD superfamily)
VARLGLEPQRCVVLEDSTAGVRSAVSAGCACVLVPTFPPTEVPAGVALRRSLTEVDLDLLATLADGSAAA